MFTRQVRQPLPITANLEDMQIMAKAIVVEIGDKFHMLTVMSKTGCESGPRQRFICSCDCGASVERSRNYLLYSSAKSRSCGCQRKANKKRSPPPIGKRYGKLVVTSEAPDKYYGQARFRRVNVQCDCGNKNVVYISCLFKGVTKSCGCGQGLVKHGMHKSRIYSIWSGMKGRCNPKNTSAECASYRRAGTSVCKDWQNSFDAFHTWAITNGYNDSLEIDRRDNRGDYTPENCQWITPHKNRCNTSRSYIWNVGDKVFESGVLVAKLLGCSFSTAAKMADEERQHPVYGSIRRQKRYQQ